MILAAIADHHINPCAFLIDDEKVVFELEPNQHVLQPQAVDSASLVLKFDAVTFSILTVFAEAHL